MSLGTKIVPVRVPPGLLEQIDQAVSASQDLRFEGGHTRSSWIIHAIRQKLAHMERSRKPRRAKASTPAQ